jgi:hypothetical protein
VKALMDELYALGPFGFRGPAAPGVPAHLTSLDAEIRTTQLIAPGYRCPSNELLAQVVELVGEDFLFIASANVSGGVTGRIEAAHYDLAGMQADFGDRDGIVLIGHDDEPAVRASYASHLPMSTSIVAFHKLERDETGRQALVLERHGSLAADEVRAIVDRHGFGLALGPGARERLPVRDEVRVEEVRRNKPRMAATSRADASAHPVAAVLTIHPNRRRRRVRRGGADEARRPVLSVGEKPEVPDDRGGFSPPAAFVAARHHRCNAQMFGGFPGMCSGGGEPS